MKLEKFNITAKLKTASHKLSFLRLFCFLLAVVLISSEATDADLSDQEIVTGNLFTTTTLDFSSQNTANHHPLSIFFSVADFVPDGFAVNSVLLKKQGEQDSPLRLTAQMILGNQDLFNAFDLKIMSDWQVVYDGKLSNLIYDFALIDADQQSLIFFLNLSSADVNLKDQDCQFNFVFQTIINTPDSGGFSDQEILANYLSTSVW